MADINEIRDTVLNSLGTTVVKARKIRDKAATKAKGLTRLAKLSIELSTQKDIMDSAYTEIGRLYYKTRKDSPDNLFIQLCAEITEAEKNLAKLQSEIDALRKADAESSAPPCGNAAGDCDSDKPGKDTLSDEPAPAKNG